MAEPARDELTCPPTELELERWRFERDCRQRELALKEREQSNRDAEIELRRHEQSGATWRSPLTVAILAAAVAGGGNAIVAWFNGTLQRDLENTRRGAEVDLEKTRAESTRILEMIKTGNSETAASNLDFLLKSGLVTDQAIQGKLTAYLASRTPGTGPALPSPGNARIGFDDATPANRPLQEQLQTRLNDFLAFLDRVGFPPSKQKVLVRIENGEINNAYYDGQRIVIDKRLADDPSVALREYSHHVLRGPDAKVPLEGQYDAIESALADYFACSFLDNPRLGEKAARVLQMGQPQIRRLDNQRSFAEFDSIEKTMMHYDGAEVWGGLFWQLRARLGRETADKLLARAWMQFIKVPVAEGQRAAAFARRITDEAAKQGDAARQAVLRERKFPVSE